MEEPRAVTDLDELFKEDWPEDHRSGVVAVVGRPNVGKSTLINAILGQKIAIVTPKPQTTRRQQLGIYTVPNGQILFTDTPGLHKPQHKLGEFMVQAATGALEDADIILWVLDVSEPPQKPDEFIAERLKNRRSGAPVVLALNKADLLDVPLSDAQLEAFTGLVDAAGHWLVSAQTTINVPQLVEDLLARLPLGPRYFPADQLSEVNLRFIAAEVVREKVMLHTEKEVPHSVAVGVDSYKNLEDGTAEIYATIYVEKDSQKGIIIGKGGKMIKRIGTEARTELESIVEQPVQLFLHAKVLKNWRSQDRTMRRFGYFIPKD